MAKAMRAARRVQAPDETYEQYCERLEWNTLHRMEARHAARTERLRALLDQLGLDP